MIDAKREQILEYVEKQYKHWWYVETLYGEEYNDWDEAIDAKMAEGMYEGARDLASMILQEQVSMDHDKMMAELEEMVLQRIEMNQALADKYGIYDKDWTKRTPSEQVIAHQIGQDIDVLLRLEEED